MEASVFFLWLGVLWVGAAWIVGIHKATQGKLTLPAGAIFATLTAFHLALALSGVASDFSLTPPPPLPFFLLNLGVAFTLAFSRFGDALISRFTLQTLVGFHAFRIIAELLLFAGFKEGRTPIQLTFEGHNFDIVTGVTALILAAYLSRRESLALVRWWNAMGVAFLCIIAFIAMTSMPVAFRVYMNEPSNIWVTTSPYILLPGIMVTAAICGHILIFRKLAKFSRT